MVKSLVFIHGWASSPEIWQGQIEYFAKNYEVILPDISAAKDIKEAAGLVNVSLAIKKDFALIGWSLGWLVVLELLKNFSISPQGLVAVNSTPKLIDDGYLGAGLTKTHLAKMIRDCKRNPKKTLEDFYKSTLTDIGKTMLNTVSHKNSGYDKLIYGLYILRDCDYRDFLKAIHIPTLLITGARDTICPKEASVYMHKMIQGAQLKILDSGHVPFIEKDKEFNGLVEDFIDGLS